MRTLRRMGIGSVAVYSEAGRGRRCTSAAGDEAVAIGGPPPPRATCDADKILEAAQRTGAEAIHPGYGFLTENADFAARCEAAGIAFIGPTPDQIRAFGLKHTARELATKAGAAAAAGHRAC